MDDETAYDRLLWLEARFLEGATRARRLRSKVRRRPWVARTEIEEEIAVMRREERARADELTMWGRWVLRWWRRRWW